MRIDEKLQTVILLILAGYGLLISIPLLLGGRVVEPFSELGVLGPEMKLGDYPHDVQIGENIDLFVYIGNHEGSVSYYKVLFKEGARDLNVSDVEPYRGDIIGQAEFLLLDGKNVTKPITIRLHQSGLNRRLVFELQQFDPTSGYFKYDGIWTQLWFNVTEAG
jgi:uncharacterized membrane protein